jgi:16S rRNA (cytosine967-C5)-methyltransferase
MNIKTSFILPVIDALRHTNQPLSRFLPAYYKSHRQLGSKDRRFVTDFIYGLVRHYGHVSQALSVDPLPFLVNASSALYAAAYSQLVLKTESDAPLSLDEANQLAAALSYVHPSGNSNLSSSMPAWLRDQLKSSVIQSLNTPAPCDIRIADQAAAKHLLGAEVLGPTALRLPSGKGLRDLGVDHAIQDYGAQWICAHLPTKANDYILDYCAGAGGKSLALAQKHEGQVWLYLSDCDEARLKRARKRFGQTPYNPCAYTKLSPCDAQINHKRLSLLGDGFDIVIADVPCTGVGTWRRDPAARWRLTPNRLAELQSIQRSILSQAAPFVKPGGCLAYITCSLLAAENQDQVSWFLGKHANFVTEALGHQIGMDPACEFIYNDGNFMGQTLGPPHSDGFFVCLLRRVG